MSRNYWTIWGATLLFFAAFYALMAPFPLYLTRLGLPDWQVGVILGALGITSLLVRPLAGVATDYWGRQKVMLLGTVALIGGAVGVSLTGQPVLLFGLRVLQATGYVTFTTAATAMISDLAPAGKQASALALFGVAANLAMTLAPAVVTALLERLTLTGAFWLAGLLAGLGGLVTGQVRAGFSSPKNPTTNDPEGTRAGWVELLGAGRQLRWPMITAALFGMGYGAFLQFTPLLADRRALGSAGLVYTIYGLSIILTRLLTGRWLDRGRPRPILLFAFLMLGLGLSGLALASRQIQLLTAAGLIALGSGLLHPLLIAIHIGQVPVTQRGQAGALFYLGFDLGIGAGAWLFAPIFQGFGLTGLYLLAAGVALLGVLPAWWLNFAGQALTLSPAKLKQSP